MFGRGALKRFRPFGAGASSSSASALAASAAAAAGLPPVAAIAAAPSLSSPAQQRRRDAGGSSASASSAAAAAAEPSGSIKRRKFGSSAQAAILESTDRAIRQQREREQQTARARSTFEDEMDPDERQEYVRNKNRAQSEFRTRFRERAAREGRVPANGERWTDEEYAQAVDDEAALWFANRRAEQADQNQRRGIVPEDERAPADVPMLEEVGAVANADALDAEVDELFGSMLAKTAEQCDEAKQRMRLSTAQALSTDLLRDVRQCAGDLTMDAIARALNNMGCVRSEFQALFHEAFIQACLPIIYGSDWPLVCARVFHDLGIDELRQEVLIQTPRRFGKTKAVSMFVAALLAEVPGIRICIFSTGRRASSALMLEVRTLLSVLGQSNRVIRQNCEQLFLSPTALGAGISANGDKANALAEGPGVSKLYSFPAGTAGRIAHRQGARAGKGCGRDESERASERTRGTPIQVRSHAHARAHTRTARKRGGGEF